MREYEKQVKKMLSIDVSCDEYLERPPRNIWIDNVRPFFIWSEIEPTQSIKKFSALEKKSANVSIFIYNKHQRPLKVSCEFYWVQP